MGIFDEALSGIQQRLSSFTGPQAKSPFGGGNAVASPFKGTQAPASPFLAQGGVSSPFTGNRAIPSPFGGQQRVPSPFGGQNGIPSPFGGQRILASPFGQNAFSGFSFNTPAQIQAGARAAQQKATGNTTGTSTGGSGKGSTGIEGDETWARIDALSGLIDEAAAAVGEGFDGDVFRAIMYNESGGIPTAHNSIGASGLLQLMPEVWQGKGDPFDPRTNLQLGAGLMKEKIANVKASYQKNGITADPRQFALDLALAWAGHFNYKTGRANPDSTDVLFGQTAAQLSAVFLKHYDAVKGARAKQQPTGGNANLTGDVADMWGGVDAPITQEIGPTEFSNANSAIYEYGNEYGVQGHTGLDIGVKRGTKLFMPKGVGGTVTIAGGTQYFGDDDYSPKGTAGKGELRITLDNGWILILGHTSSINVKQGQRVNPGDLVALSGTANGDHLHLELRVPDKSTRSGYRIVDPRQYFKR